MLNYLIGISIILLALGVVVLFVQVMKLAWHVKMVDDVVVRLVKGEKITLKKIDDNTN